MKTWWLVLMSRSRRDSATTGLGNSGYQSAAARLEVRISERPGAFGDQLVEVVGLGGGELAHGEVVEDQDGGAGELGEPGAPGAVGVAAGEVGEQPAGLGERGRSCAAAEARWPRAWAIVVLPTPTGPWRMTDSPACETAQGGEVADLRRRGASGWRRSRSSSRVACLLEAGAAEPAGEGGGVAAGDLVLAQDLEELEVAELPGAGLGEAGVEGVEHPGQLQVRSVGASALRSVIASAGRS